MIGMGMEDWEIEAANRRERKELREERDRYREALERIVAAGPEDFINPANAANDHIQIARQALEEIK